MAFRAYDLFIGDGISVTAPRIIEIHIRLMRGRGT
jgi:hypothetical protein